MLRCKRCGHEVDYATGICRSCGLRQWGVSQNPEKDTSMTKLELWGVRAERTLRRISNRVATFEHKSLVAALVLAVIGIIVITMVSSCLRG